MRAALASLLLVAFAAPGCGEGLTVTRVDPAQLPAGAGGTIRVHGEGLTPQTAVSLRAGEINVTLGIEDLDEDGALVVRVPAAAPVGTYDVVAEARSLVASLEGAFTITADRARMVFVDVGQGDCTLAIGPQGSAMLIDGGRREEGDVVADAIATHVPSGELSAVVVSHFDADHLGGVVEVLSGRDGEPGTADDLVPAVRWAPVDDGSCESQTCNRYRALAAYPFETPTVGQSVDIDGVTATVVAKDGYLAGGLVGGSLDDNSRSVVIELSYASRSVLVLGDLTGGGSGTVDLETPLAELTGSVDVLRTAHHGSDTSSAAAAVSTWAPRLAVMSFGTDNAYCHPAAGALGRVSAAATEVVATGSGIVDDGDRCDGPTDVPANADFGRSTMVLEIDAVGSMSLDGEPL